MQFLSLQFENSAAFSSALQEQGWMVDFLQLDRGREDVNLQAVSGEDLSLLRVDLSNRVHQRVLPPAGALTFGLPTRPQAPGLMGRRPLLSESLTCFDTQQGMSSVSQAGFSAFTITAPEQRIAQLAESVGLGSPVGNRTMLGAQCLPRSRELVRWRTYLSEWLRIAGSQGVDLESGALRVGESDLLLELLQSFATGERVTYVPVRNRHRALRWALAYIAERPQLPITVEELCRESAASISTLERAFREHFGVSPKRYLVATRLHQVRRTLIAGNDIRSISDIASDWGFWHMSKFAADYKRMFGELPSATRQVA